MQTRFYILAGILALSAIAAGMTVQQGHHDALEQDVLQAVAAGRQTFRHDTFGDEHFWGGELRLHEAIAESLSPALALELGLKVDVDVLPNKLLHDIAQGKVDLEDPATTLVLLQKQAVVGVTGFFDDAGELTSVGIQCALCHSTVDDSFAPGLGLRLDGWANRDLDIGRIVALAPDLSPFADLLGATEGQVKDVLESWGPGKFDAELVLDGETKGPEGSSATLIPPAFGLAGVNLHTWTGWGSVTHWNAFVANLEMHGIGTFFDPRLDDAGKFPVAAANDFGHIVPSPGQEDRITPKLADLHVFQLALRAPAPPAGSFDAAAAARGQQLFLREAKCATCHVPPLFTEPGWNMHTPAEVGVDSFQADRSPDERYRTTPLKGLWTHQTGGFYHDGRFATLEEVIEHYEPVLGVSLSDQQVDDLVQYLLSL